MNPRFKTDNSRTISGFTLIEVLVALSIIAVAITIVLQLFSVNLRAISASDSYLSAVTKAEAKMREVLDNEDLTEKSWSDVTPDGYRMDIYISDILKDRTNTLQVRLMEVGLTMRWIDGTKEKMLALRTMKLINKTTLATTATVPKAGGK
jgi:general secretion pathway protein I